jgi:hypothetical protein
VGVKLLGEKWGEPDNWLNMGEEGVQK